MKIDKTKILFIVICIFQLFYLFYFRSGFEFQIIKNPFSKNSGTSYAVSNEVIESSRILNLYTLKEFNISNKITGISVINDIFCEIK